MTAPPRQDDTVSPAVVADEIAAEQAHVDRVYVELDKAVKRTDTVRDDGLARGRTDRTGDIRDEEMTGLFERDALVFNAARRRRALDHEYEGLVFGRLDLSPGADPEAEHGREVRYIGRIGVRDDDYEPLVIDWRAPAASAFYRATPVEPMDVLRRRVLRCQGSTVIGVEDDLMVPEPPDDLVIIGDGALLAALTRSRGTRMRDIVATIQRDQDEAIRAPWRGVTLITGGPGTGKTVVALHRAAYLLYSERRRFESGGILVVGPSAAYTAYIERVLPSLGEDSVALRAVGDLVDGVTATRVDQPEVAAIKGDLRIRQLLDAVAALPPEGAPAAFRSFVAGIAVHLDESALTRIRGQVLRGRPHNLASRAAREALLDAAWSTAGTEDRDDFADRFDTSIDVDTFMEEWWPQLDPREVLLRLADTDLVYRLAPGILDDGESAALAGSIRDALELGTWSVGDVGLIDELALRLGPVQPHQNDDEHDFYDLDDRFDEHGTYNEATLFTTVPSDPLDRLMAGTIDPPRGYAHVLVDEAQDLSPMQWRMLARRGRTASWTVVGDSAQASWTDAAAAEQARDAAFEGLEVRRFRMTTNYRNAREIFDYARRTVLAHIPDADIPTAVRETGVEPVEFVMFDGSVTDNVLRAVDDLAREVDGSIAVITPVRWHDELSTSFDGHPSGRVQVIDPLSAKGLEWDATVIVDPARIVDESPGGVRVLYVALTRAAHRMTVLRPATTSDVDGTHWTSTVSRRAAGSAR